MTESAVFWTAYFRERPAYSRILQELRQKYRRYGHPAGTVRLEDASEEECRALRNILESHFLRRSGSERSGLKPRCGS